MSSSRRQPRLVPGGPDHQRRRAAPCCASACVGRLEVGRRRAWRGRLRREPALGGEDLDRLGEPDRPGHDARRRPADHHRLHHDVGGHEHAPGREVVRELGSGDRGGFGRGGAGLAAGGRVGAAAGPWRVIAGASVGGGVSGAAGACCAAATCAVSIKANAAANAALAVARPILSLRRCLAGHARPPSGDRAALDPGFDQIGWRSALGAWLAARDAAVVPRPISVQITRDIRQMPRARPRGAYGPGVSRLGARSAPARDGRRFR